MKKSSLLALLTLCFACNDELAVTPDGTGLQVADVITESDVDNDIFMIVEDMPSFPGGQDAYYNYLGTNIKYPKEAQDLGIEGRVHLTFVVNKDGSLSDIQLLQGIGAGCDEEALRVFMESPNWTPGKQRGRIVKTKMQATVTFELGQKNEKMLELQMPDRIKKSFDSNKEVIEEIEIESSN